MPTSRELKNSEKLLRKTFLVSKKYILGEVAKWAVVQSPYHRPENLEAVLDELNGNFGKWENEYEYFTYKQLRDFLGRELKRIPKFLLWNERKNGNQSPYKFTDRYSGKGNPDDDFIDLDALIRNVANSLIREGTEKSIPEILGEPMTFFSFVKNVLKPNIKGNFVELTQKQNDEYRELLRPEQRTNPLLFRGKEIKII